eukprot:scaffold6351_cov166-Amphora_coffeaeformis.AAC.12
MKFLTVSSLLCFLSAVSALQPPETPFSHKGTTSKDPNKQGVKRVFPGFERPDPFNGSTTASGGGASSFSSGAKQDNDKTKLQQVWPGYAKPDPFHGSKIDAGASDPDKHKLKPMWPGYAIPDPVKGNHDATTTTANNDNKSGMKPVFPEW